MNAAGTPRLAIVDAISCAHQSSPCPTTKSANASVTMPAAHCFAPQAQRAWHADWQTMALCTLGGLDEGLPTFLQNYGSDVAAYFETKHESCCFALWPPKTSLDCLSPNPPRAGHATLEIHHAPGKCKPAYAWGGSKRHTDGDCMQHGLEVGHVVQQA